MLRSTHPSAGAKILSQVSVFLFGVFFQLVLDVLDELFHKGGIKLEEWGNLPALNSKTRWQRRDASLDAASKYRLLIYYPAGCWIWCERSQGAALMLPLSWGLPVHIQCRSSHWLKQGAKHKINTSLPSGCLLRHGAGLLVQCCGSKPPLCIPEGFRDALA